MGPDWGEPSAEDVWDEVRSLSPVHAGMSYARLEELGGIQWPCYDETHPGELFLHSRLWEDPVPGNRVPFVPVDHDPPVDKLDDDFPIRLTTGRRLDSYNTGVQTAGYTSPLRRGESLDISPEDAARYGLADGERVRVVSRRGQVEAPIRIDPSLRPGLTFMTLHFQDDVADQPADDRRDRPEVRHRRVQGDRDPDREARRRPCRRLTRMSDARGPSHRGEPSARGAFAAVGSRPDVAWRSSSRRRPADFAPRRRLRPDARRARRSRHDAVAARIAGSASRACADSTGRRHAARRARASRGFGR